MLIIKIELTTSIVAIVRPSHVETDDDIGGPKSLRHFKRIDFRFYTFGEGK